MLKNISKWKLIVSTLICLLPMAAGLMLWGSLPDQVPIHWGIDGQVDRWGGKWIVVFGLPLFFAAIHWLCLLMISADPKNKDQGKKASELTLWICPVFGTFAAGMIFGTCLGIPLNTERLTPMILGLSFMVIGNYMPKLKPNYTRGIKVPWAIHNEENWVATHRFGGKVWVAGGVTMMVCALLPQPFGAVGMVVVILAVAGLPAVYSYLYYKKHNRG